MPILVPGIGAQGGDINAVIRAGTTTTPSSATTSQATTSAAATSPISSTVSQSADAPAISHRGLIINSSRAILYATDGANYATAARKVAIATRDAINSAN
jgi:orotidine-5'-phosphate decarboxylase